MLGSRLGIVSENPRPETAASLIVAASSAREIQAMSVPPGIDPPSPPKSIIPFQLMYLAELGRAPAMFAVALGALSVVALGRGLVFRARLRRHDLVVLRALGLRSRDVLGVVLGEALVVVAVATTLGLTAGCLIGASMWRLVAEQFGVASATMLPLVQLALVVGATLTIALGVVAVSVARTSRAYIGTQLRVE